MRSSIVVSIDWSYVLSLVSYHPIIKIFVVVVGEKKIINTNTYHQNNLNVTGWMGKPSP